MSIHCSVYTTTHSVAHVCKRIRASGLFIIILFFSGGKKFSRAEPEGRRTAAARPRQNNTRRRGGITFSSPFRFRRAWARQMSWFLVKYSKKVWWSEYNVTTYTGIGRLAHLGFQQKYNRIHELASSKRAFKFVKTSIVCNKFLSLKIMKT